MIRLSEAMTVLWIIYLLTSVDVAHADVLFLYIYILCHIHRYVYASVLWITRDQKLKRAGMLYRVAQNKWDLLLKLCMGYF